MRNMQFNAFLFMRSTKSGAHTGIGIPRSKQGSSAAAIYKANAPTKVQDAAETTGRRRNSIENAVLVSTSSQTQLVGTCGAMDIDYLQFMLQHDVKLCV